MHFRKQSKNKAFTLIEIMMAMSIMTLALAALMPFIYTTLKTFYINQSQSVLLDQVSLAYEQIQQDSANCQYVFVLEKSGNPNNLNQPTNGAAPLPFLKRNKAGNALVMLQCSLTTNATDSTTNLYMGSAIGNPGDYATETITKGFVYFLEPQSGYPGFFTLYRKVINSPEVDWSISGATVLLKNVTILNASTIASGGDAFVCASFGKGAVVKLFAHDQPFIVNTQSSNIQGTSGISPNNIAFQFAITAHL